MLYYCPLLLIIIKYIKNDKEVYLIHLCGEYVPRCTVRRVKTVNKVCVVRLNLAFCKNEEPEQVTN
jgi:hypothetical protein